MDCGGSSRSGAGRAAVESANKMMRRVCMLLVMCGEEEMKKRVRFGSDW